MASGGKNTAGTEVNRLTCSVCLEPFRQPRLLPCFHTFCTPCLQELADSVVTGATDKESTCKGKEQDSSGTDQNSETVDTKSSSFLCPTCRKPVTVPPGGVKEFQSNFYLEADMSDQKPSAPACDMCDEDNTAAYVCNECQQNLCQTCRGFHDRVAVTKSHQVTSLAKGRGKQTGITKSAPASREDFCRAHGDQKLLFYCHQCQAAICLYCKLTSHEGHTTEDMAVAAERIRAEVHKLSVDLETKMKIADRVVMQVTKELQELQQQRQTVMEEAQASAEKIMAWVKQAQDKLSDQVEEIADPINKKLQDQLEQAVGTKTALADQQNRVKTVLQSGTHSDWVQIKAELEKSYAAGMPAELTNQPGKEAVFFRHQADNQTMTQTTVCKFIGEAVCCDSGVSREAATAGLQPQSTKKPVSSIKLADGMYSVGCFDFLGSQRIIEVHKSHYDMNSKKYVYELCVFDFLGMQLYRSKLPAMNCHITSLKYLSPEVILMATNAGTLMSVLCLGNPETVDPALGKHVLLSHNNVGSKVFCLGSVSSRLYVVHEICSDTSGNISVVPFFQIIYQGRSVPRSFDMSTDAQYCAVLRPGNDQCQTVIDIYSNQNSHPCFTYYEHTYITQDICFSGFGGKEMLRLTMRGINSNVFDCVRIVDHRNSCTTVHSMDLESPGKMACNHEGMVAIACSASGGDDSFEIIVISP